MAVCPRCGKDRQSHTAREWWRHRRKPKHDVPPIDIVADDRTDNDIPIIPPDQPNWWDDDAPGWHPWP